VGVLAVACASSTAAAPPATGGGEEVTTVRHVDRAGPVAPPATLAGARCRDSAAGCTCRASGDDTEAEPPAQGNKRLEIRMSADRGEAELSSPTFGRIVTAGVRESCYYVDVAAGSKQSFSFVSRATDPASGVTPRLAIAEYGPAGPFWYEVLAVECAGVNGRCDRAGADKWVQTLKERQRGRVDPCGSMVITGLAWDTSGGQHSRDGGFYRDFSVKFDMEAKKFATKFAPGSTECVPK
jgi:hypothetical protein